MNPEAESILEQCLDQLAAGEATVQDCLAAYPDQAGELRPMLLVAERLRVLPRPSMAPGAKARLEAQLLERLDARVQPARPARRPAWRRVPVGLGAAAALIVLALVLLGLSSRALPGSPLYAVKRAVEETRLWVAPAEAEPALRLRFAQRRLDEIEALAERGAVDMALLEAVVQETDGILAAAEALPPERAVPALEGLAELSGRISQTLTGLLARDASLSRARVLALRAALDAQVARAGALLARFRDQLPPPTTEAPKPTDTVAAGGTVQPTTGTSNTPTATQLAPPASTSLAGPTATLGAVATPTPIKTKNTPPAWGLTKTAEPPAHGLTKTPSPADKIK